MPSSRPIAAVRSRLGRLRHGHPASAEPGPMEEANARLDRQLARLETQGRRLDSHQQKIGELRTALNAMNEALRDRLTPIEKRDAVREVEHVRLHSQVGAIEERLGRIEELLSYPRMAVSEGADGEAVEVLAAIRREHEQIRVRMQIISSYEERLRRVEASVIAMYQGDHRHQV